MDKYEYRIKADQIKKLVNEGDYISAMKLADTIDWRRVKNVSMLCTVSDIYEKNAKYEESHELLLMAYDRSPIGRMMVYKLAELAIKMEDYEEAIDYYREFVHLSPGDIAADILKYKIYKAKGASPEELIPIMEAFKEKEYHEEWAYELAHLYHEAGMGSKCVEECDEIILWFSEGKFVEKAMELKMLYRPLTPEQQEKYDHRFDIKEEVTSYYDEEDEESMEVQDMIDSSKIQVITEDMFSDEVDPNDITIKPVNLGKYDTINLQAELAKSMEQIMSATEKEAVDSTMENIRKLVEDSQILDINFDEELEKNEIFQENLQVEIPVAVNENEEKKSSFDKVLAEERDGQISLYMPEANILEKQITGQIKIEDVLKEWDRMKSAAELAIKEAELKRLNEAKSKALQKAENIMSKLSLIISEEEMKANGQEIAAAIEASFLEEDEALAQVAASLEKGRESDLSLKELQEEEIRYHTDMIDISKELEALEDLNSEEELPLEADVKEAEIKEVKELDEATPDNITEDSNISLEDTKENTKEEQPEAVIEEEADDTSNLSANIEAILADELDTTSNEYQEEEKKQVIAESSGLTKEQKEAFAAFLSVRGVEKSLNAIFDSINESSSAGIPFDVGYIAVLGNEKTGKTTLAMEIAKEIQIAQHKKSAKVAKISANTLNIKDIKQLTNKMEGGVLIIEKAGNLTEKTIKGMMSAIREANEEILLILEDTKSGIKALLSKDTDFANRVTNQVELPEYNNDELVEFGKDYAKTLMYTIDDMAILALYTCLGNIQKDEEALTIDQVKEIVDKAIVQSNKKKLKKLKDIIMKRRYDEEKRVILLEEDFENIM
ncbi:hypothetical protein [Candidatus Galacturonibacter soehngenii]|uniref:Tetratricopeptide repeat protein n=1 Tax=Candidatus Galacturonatibacter soehngenii TaxID=2307010 RepID=A0A7V7QLG3_9FIRM|nr:hypothetical protein [Candidatus Galacturonibacter soehngenii]KAB1438666.1 hypothetical protein F7O84_14165 [Candidatus Galacturonibacter soehngenii]MBA4685706.1 hypothetical protein [Candidatus Galacturonibacter soehngenii]